MITDKEIEHALGMTFDVGKHAAEEAADKVLSLCGNLPHDLDKTYAAILAFGLLKVRYETMRKLLLNTTPEVFKLTDEIVDELISASPGTIADAVKMTDPAKLAELLKKHGAI